MKTIKKLSVQHCNQDCQLQNSSPRLTVENIYAENPIEVQTRQVKYEDKSIHFTIEDSIRLTGGSLGRFQIISTLCFCLIFSVGSQFFISIPFYQLYPSLNCYDKMGQLIDESQDLDFQESTNSKAQLGYCSVQYACKSPKVNHFEIDWNSDTSVHNWVSDLNLICNEPYEIAFIGSMSFLSFSIGSIMFTNTIDHYGRKKVIVISALVTPVVMSLMLLFANSLTSIYVFIFIMGLTYNTRGSTAYLYCSEFLEQKVKLKFGQCNFICQGLMSAVAGFWFYMTKSQRDYFILNIGLMIIAISWIIIAVPESPVWLFEKRMFSRLEQSLNKIAKINNVLNREEIIQICMEKLQITAAILDQEKKEKKKLEKEQPVQCACVSKISLCVDTTIRNNLIAVCFIWSMSGFINYLVIYYSKYFKGSVYTTYSIGAFAECFSFFYVIKIAQHRTVTEFLKILIGVMIALTLLLIFLEESGFIPEHMFIIVLAIMVFFIRLQVVSIQNYGYHINQQLFPILLRGRAYGVTNFVSRPFAGMAPIVSEYTNKPLIFVLVFASISVFFIRLIKVLEDEGRQMDNLNGKEEKPLSSIGSPQEDLQIVQEPSQEHIMVREKQYKNEIELKVEVNVNNNA